MIISIETDEAGYAIGRCPFSFLEAGGRTCMQFCKYRGNVDFKNKTIECLYDKFLNDIRDYQPIKPIYTGSWNVIPTQKDNNERDNRPDR